LAKLSQIRGIVLDMDGVLIHSATTHEQAFSQVFNYIGINDFDYSLYAGWRTTDVVADVFRTRGIASSPGAIASAASEKTHLARQLLAADYPLDRNCGRVLGQLGANFRLALASSGSRQSVDTFLKNSGARSFFGSVLSGDDVTRAKPDPELYARSIEALNLPPQDCLVVEDAPAGVRAGKLAGARVVGLAGTVSKQELEQAGADYVLETLGDLPQLVEQSAPIHRPEWTAIIPAAGKGSRLGFHRPKILFPVAGRMILEWMLDFLEPCYAHLVFVLSPDGHTEVVGELNKLIPGRFTVVIQEVPTGMGDAVQLALPEVKTPHVTVVWGDQVALQRSSVEACQRLHQGPLQADLTCPTVWRAKPYIHFDRDETGKLVGLRQAREGDAMPENGESDTGFFCFNSDRLRELLQQMRTSRSSMGTSTGEFNLLPVIPVAAQQGVVLTPHIMRLEETQGINSSEDAGVVAEFLRRAHGR